MLDADHLNSVRCCIDGKWVAARPIPMMAFSWRLKDAWAVFIGNADAVMFYKQ